MNTLHISFGAHYVTVASELTELCRELTTMVEPMLRLQTRGTQVGFLKVSLTGNSFVVRGSDASLPQSLPESTAAARAVYHRSIRMLMAARDDLLWIHAGVVCLSGQAVVMAAPSGHGKSTMVGECVSRAWRYMSDDIAPIDPADGTVVPFPLSPYKRVSADVEFTEEQVHRLKKVSIQLSRDAVSRVGAPITDIYFLRYAPGCSVTRIVQCSAGQAVMELLRNSLSPCESRHTELERLCRLAVRVRAHFLHYSSAVKAVQEVIAARMESPQRVAI